MEPEKSQFDQGMTPQEQMLEDLLARALRVTPPSGLSDRVAGASIASIRAVSGQTLEQQLDMALASSLRDGMNTRIFEASVSSLPSHIHDEPSPVLARINVSVLMRQVALAACLAFAAILAIYFSSTPSLPAAYGAKASVSSTVGSMVATSSNSADVLSVEDEELLLEDLHLSQYTYLTDTREMAFADIAVELNGLRDDIELWQFGLLNK